MDSPIGSCTQGRLRSDLRGGIQQSIQVDPRRSAGLRHCAQRLKTAANHAAFGCSGQITRVFMTAYCQQRGARKIVCACREKPFYAKAKNGYAENNRYKSKSLALRG